jgi:hypothetical protein
LLPNRGAIGRIAPEFASLRLQHTSSIQNFAAASPVTRHLPPPWLKAKHRGCYQSCLPITRDSR